MDGLEDFLFLWRCGLCAAGGAGPALTYSVQEIETQGLKYGLGEFEVGSRDNIIGTNVFGSFGIHGVSGLDG